MVKPIFYKGQKFEFGKYFRVSDGAWFYNADGYTIYKFKYLTMPGCYYDLYETDGKYLKFYLGVIDNGVIDLNESLDNEPEEVYKMSLETERETICPKSC